MKVIFLDVDGVLNHENHMQNEYNNKRPTSSHYLALDHDKIKLLADFVHQTGAIVVISSSWRIGGFEKTKAIKNLSEQLNQYGIIISGFTPTSFERIRGREIAQWIVRNCSTIPYFCIFDDDKDMEELADNHLIKTSWSKGLLPEHIKMAREILERQPSEAVVNYIIEEGSK